MIQTVWKRTVSLALALMLLWAVPTAAAAAERITLIQLKGTDVTLDETVFTYTGQEIWYKSHPALSSNDIREAKAVPIKDRPELCTLQLRLNRQGRLKWQILYQLHKETPLIMLIDGVWVGDFAPGSLDDPDQEWVDVDCVVDSVTASGIVKHAPGNFQEAHPDDGENSDSLF